MADDSATVAAKYFESWKARDFDAFRSLLADDATFDDPMGHAGNADECVEGIKGMSKMVTGIDVKKIFTNGSDVVTWFELHTEGTEPLPTANWTHVEDGKITRIQVTFDPRPLFAGSDT